MPLHHMISLMPILLVMTLYLTDVKLLYTELLSLIGAYGVECVLDEIAEKLNMCPLELRKLMLQKKEPKQSILTYPQMGYLDS